MKTIQISVVIPCFNMANSISRAINSVLNQTYPHFELWIIDDGSTDQLHEILQNFNDPRLHIVRQQNAGVSAARNTGIAHATSDYVAFLDADDHWEPEFLSAIVSLITSFPDAVFFATNYAVGGNPHLDTYTVNRILDNGSQIFMKDYFKYFKEYDVRVTSSSVAIRKDVLTNIGGFSVGVHSGEDLLMWAQIAVQGGLGFDTRVLSHYERDEKIRPPDPSDYVGTKLKEIILIYPKSKFLVSYIGQWYLNKSRVFLHLRNRKLGFRYIKESFAWDGFSFRKLFIFIGLLIPYHLVKLLLKQSWFQTLKQRLQ